MIEAEATGFVVSGREEVVAEVCVFLQRAAVKHRTDAIATLYAACERCVAWRLRGEEPRPAERSCGCGELQPGLQTSDTQAFENVVTSIRGLGAVVEQHHGEVVDELRRVAIGPRVPGAEPLYRNEADENDPTPEPPEHPRDHGVGRPPL